MNFTLVSVFAVVHWLMFLYTAIDGQSISFGCLFCALLFTYLHYKEPKGSKPSGKRLYQEGEKNSRLYYDE